MKYTFRRKSGLSGITRDRILEVDQEGLDRWSKGAMVQEAFPYLTPGEREFIITGITEEEWDEFIAPGGDE